MIHLNWHALWYFFFLCLANLGSCVCAVALVAYARTPANTSRTNIGIGFISHVFRARAGHNKGVVDFFDVLRKNFSPARCGKQYVCNCREAHTEHGLFFFCARGGCCKDIGKSFFYYIDAPPRPEYLPRNIEINER